MNIVKFVQDYVKFPGISADPQYKEGILDTAKFLANALETAGAKAEIVETDGNPVVMGRYNAHRTDLPHVVVYGHYDVQPVDPINLWATPPFEPTIRDGKIYGRGTADNRGPHSIAIVAFANLLKRNPDLPLRLTFTFEGEEEIGSKSFPKFLKEHREELSTGDFVLLSDTSSPRADLIALTIGLRGVVGLHVDIEGPNSDLHSGLHGGAVYNPLQALAEVCASLHNPDGSVNVPGFYDGMLPPADWEREEMKRLGQSDEDYMKFLGVEALHPLPGYNGAEATRFAPTLEFNGLGGGYQGPGSKTIVPAKAFVKITCRLVPGMDPIATRQKVADTILARMPKGVKASITPMQGSPAYYVCPPNRENSDPNLNPALAAAFEAAESAIKNEFGNAPVYTREGGSIGVIEEFKKTCGMDSMMLGFFLPESCIHAPNENIDIALLEKGVKTYEAIFESLLKKK